MAQTLSIYLGSDKAGKIRRKALESEAKRRDASVSSLMLEAIERFASPELRMQLQKADVIEGIR